MPNKEIHEKLLELREKHNLKQRDIAQLIDIGQQSYSNYEVGRRELPIYLLKRLATYYQVSTDYLIDLPDNLVGNQNLERDCIENYSYSQLIYDLDCLELEQRKEIIHYLMYMINEKSKEAPKEMQ